jgi:hypothetical protein
MQFKLIPYIRGELYQLKDIDNKNVYLEIKLNRSPGNNFIINFSYKEYYSKGSLNEQQIKEILKIVEQLADNKYITEIGLELNRGE